ncbi:hypothetical protein [Phyllobacterium phragmitis]|uniref:Uncharacterized protein n=1 Tax=Phyllobacterium phragmitis TaxID=2670329 RepID=A0ABQ0H157_9HYPH
MEAVIAVIKLIWDLLTGWRKGTKEDQLRAEKEAWDWLDKHLERLEELAKDAYSFILKNSAESVMQEAEPGKPYPFVEKLNTFPAGDRNALAINFRKLKGVDRKRAYAKCRDYLDLWDKCMGKFPGPKPDLPHDRAIFEKAAEIFKSATGR